MKKTISILVGFLFSFSLVLHAQDCDKALLAKATKGSQQFLKQTGSGTLFFIVPYYGNTPSDPTLPSWYKVLTAIGDYGLNTVSGLENQFNPESRVRFIKVTGKNEDLKKAHLSPYVLWSGLRADKKALSKLNNELRSLSLKKHSEPSKDLNNTTPSNSPQMSSASPNIREQKEAAGWETFLAPLTVTKLSIELQNQLKTGSTVSVNIFINVDKNYDVFSRMLNDLVNNTQVRVSDVRADLQGVFHIVGDESAILKIAAESVVQFIDVVDGDFSRVFKKMAANVRERFISMYSIETQSFTIMVNDKDEKRLAGDTKRVADAVTMVGGTLTKPPLDNFGLVFAKVNRVQLYKLVNLMPEISLVELDQEKQASGR